MLEYVRQNICDVEQFELLKSNQFRTVYLVNNKLVVMFSANAKLIFNWYMANQNFAPATIFGYDDCVCYDYLIPSSDYLRRSHLIDFIKSYRPKVVSISNDAYYDGLESKYRTQCTNLGMSSDSLKRPDKEVLYQLHGNMDFDHTIVFDNKLILLDPRPTTGAILFDIMNMYLSSFVVMEMFALKDIASFLNISIDDVLYYYRIILIEKLTKLINSDEEMYQRYKRLCVSTTS